MNGERYVCMCKGMKTFIQQGRARDWEYAGSRAHRQVLGIDRVPVSAFGWSWYPVHMLSRLARYRHGRSEEVENGGEGSEEGGMTAERERHLYLSIICARRVTCVGREPERNGYSHRRWPGTAQKMSVRAVTQAATRMVTQTARPRRSFLTYGSRICNVRKGVVSD